MKEHGNQLRNVLMAGVAGGLILIAPGSAWAQTADAAKPAETNAEASDDIVITARNREEKLQDVPLSVTAITSEQLTEANVRNLRDISYLTPGLSVTSGGSEFGVNPIIRGQTNLNGGGAGADPNVAVFIDGVYISNNTAINLGLIDLDRVEVVKGPVSALYGRNAFAGAINYVSRPPSLTAPHGTITAFGGNDQQYSASGSISYPLIKDVLAISLAGYYEHFGGSYKDQVNGNRAGGFKKRDAKISLIFTPSPELTVRSSYYYGKDTFGESAIAYNVNNCGARANPAAGTDPSGLGFSAFCGQFDPDAHPVEVPSQPKFAGASGNDRRVNLASLNVAYNFGGLTLTSLTGYTKVDQQRFTDFIGRRNGIPFLVTPSNTYVNLLEQFGSNTNTEDFSEEVRLQSDAGKSFRFQLGGFYFKGRNFSTTIIGIDGSRIPAGQTITGGFGQAIDYTTVDGNISQTRIQQALTHDKQLSGFVNADYDLLQGLTVSGEYRYTHQRKDQLIIRSTGCPSYLTAPTATCTGPNSAQPYLFPNGANPVSATFDFGSYRASLKYQVTPGTNVYASVANGLKGGGFNQRSVAAPDGSQPDLKYDPEKNTTFEVGIKNSFLNNRVLINIAAYHIDTKGIQVSGPSSVATNPGLVTKNFGSVHTSGFEFELAAKVAKGVKINLGAAYAAPRFGKDAFDFGAAGACGAIPACAGRVVVLPANSQYNATNAAKTALSLSGLTLPREPNFQLTGGIDLDGDLGSTGWRWLANANARFESKQYAFNNNISWYGERVIVNARLGVENATFSIAGYVNNLTNDHTPEIVSVNARLSDFGGDLDGYLPVGRQYGVIVSAKF